MKKKLILAALLALAAIVAAALAGWLALGQGRFDGLLRRAIVARIAAMSGGRVELRAFHFDASRLEATLAGLEIHGRETAGPPLFSADELRVRLKLVSFFRRKVDLAQIVLHHPALHLRLQPDGETNVPAPRRRAGPAPLAERLFALAVKEFRLENGEFTFERPGRQPTVESRFDATLHGFELALNYDPRAFYTGGVAWKELRVLAGRYRPAVSNAVGEFRIARNRIEFTRFELALAHSKLDFTGTVENFAAPKAHFRYHGAVSLAELGEILRKPRMPAGAVDFSGEGQYTRAGAGLALVGEFAAREIAMPYRFFHHDGMAARGRYELAGDRLSLPEFTAQALGGMITGTFEVDGLSKEPRMRAEAQARALDLAAVNHAVSNPQLPLDALHWGGRMDVDATVAWRGEFRELVTSGTGVVAPPSAPGALIPTRAKFTYRYQAVPGGGVVRFDQTRIETAASTLELDGTLSTRSSDLAIALVTSDLVPWNDLINTLRGAGKEGTAPVRVTGQARFRGRVLGTFARPIFAGHADCDSAGYQNLFFDHVEGELRYSPDVFRLRGARVRRGRTLVDGRLELSLEDWSFAPESEFSVVADVRGGEVAEVEKFLRRALPVTGLMDAHIEMKGTRVRPETLARVTLGRGTVYGYSFAALRGRLHEVGDNYYFDEIEMVENGARVSGRLHYDAWSGESEFRATGTNIQLGRIPWLGSSRLSLGGVAEFELSGRGPLRAPGLDGTLRLTGLTMGEDRIGGLEAHFKTQDRVMRFELFTAMRQGNLTGEGEVRLEGDLPVRARLEFSGFDLDPFYITAFHLRGLTSHSSSDGTLELAGSLRRPASLEIVANIARLEFAIQEIALRNEGPLRFTYRREEVRIEQARLTGAGTDLQLAGYARFPADPALREEAAARRLNLTLNGSVNLGLLGGFVPGLKTSGGAQVQAVVFGTFKNPQINGRVRVTDAAVGYGELPVGLAQARGEILFNASRAEIEQLEAQAGGGRLQITGGVNYANGVSYDFRTQARQVRIRYPEGVSWTVDGRLRLTGTTAGALLAGDVEVFRAAITQEFDFGGLLARMKESTSLPGTTSRFLRNLQFQIQASSAPDVRLEWASAHFQSEASLRVRGTWEHPVILGHIHLLAGEMAFRGNRYQVTRGDINFSNPFRIDPVLNVEAETRILQYEVTLNFSGPLSRLSLAYRSDPPLPSSDIIALLALGRTGEESALRSAQQVQVPELGATALLSEAISSQVGGRIERLFGVSHFRVDPFLAGTEQTPSARITIERAVTKDLTLTYISNVTSAQQQIIQIEYAVNRDVSLIALRDQNGTFGLDIKFKKRFK